MIKNLGRRKLSRTSSHRKAMLRNMATSLFQHEKIKTTLPKAKELVSFTEKLLSKARPNDLHAKKAVYSEIKDQNIRKKIFEVLVPRYESRNSGHMRIFKLGKRIGDNAEIAIVQLLS